MSSVSTGSTLKSTVTVTQPSEGRLYTRVFASILDSSINVQSVPPSVRWLWITMLLIADGNQTGVVDMPVERLAARAGLSLDQVKEGLALLSAPDIDSTSDEEEGRRIVPIREDSTRGWKLVNWDKYRAIAKEEQRREQTRVRVAAFRGKSSGNAVVTHANDSVTKAHESESEDLASSLKEETREEDKFEIAWRAYPRKRGKDEARRHFTAQVRTQAAYDGLMRAIRNYRRELTIQGTADIYVKYGSAFFNGFWRDYADEDWTPPTTASHSPSAPRLPRISNKIDPDD